MSKMDLKYGGKHLVGIVLQGLLWVSKEDVLLVFIIFAKGYSEEVIVNVDIYP
jgi:hypothetical protein